MVNYFRVPYNYHPYAYALSNPVLYSDPTGKYAVNDEGLRESRTCPSGTYADPRTGRCWGSGNGSGGSWDDGQGTSEDEVVAPQIEAPAKPVVELPPVANPFNIPTSCEIPILVLTRNQIVQQTLQSLEALRPQLQERVQRELQPSSPNDSAPDSSSQPNWVVRAGVVTPQSLQRGSASHLAVPGLYGFSVQHQPGKTINALAAAGQFPNAQISVTTVEMIEVAATLLGYFSVGVVPSPGRGYHHTVEVPNPLPDDLAQALSLVFVQMPNPARMPR